MVPNRMYYLVLDQMELARHYRHIFYNRELCQLCTYTLPMCIVLEYVECNRENSALVEF